MGLRRAKRLLAVYTLGYTVSACGREDGDAITAQDGTSVCLIRRASARLRESPKRRYIARVSARDFPLHERSGTPTTRLSLSLSLFYLHFPSLSSLSLSPVPRFRSDSTRIFGQSARAFLDGRRRISGDVCVRVCVRMCVYVCMHVRTCERVRERVCVCVSVCVVSGKRKRGKSARDESAKETEGTELQIKPRTQLVRD